MEKKQFQLNDIVEMKKQHPCGTNACNVIFIYDLSGKMFEGCQHSVMIPRKEFEKKMKKLIVQSDAE